MTEHARSGLSLNQAYERFLADDLIATVVATQEGRDVSCQQLTSPQLNHRLHGIELGVVVSANNFNFGT